LRQACSSRKKQAIALSDSAAKRIRHLLDLWNKHYLRVGCNGYSYTMNYAGKLGYNQSFASLPFFAR
ncbi:hypothetical protein SELMODRAFT_127311, partial [Selaginella moellendorffii]